MTHTPEALADAVARVKATEAAIVEAEAALILAGREVTARQDDEHNARHALAEALSAQEGREADVRSARKAAADAKRDLLSLVSEP